MRYDIAENTLETERLLLRPFRLEDAEAVAVFCDSEPVYRRTLNLPHPCSASRTGGGAMQPRRRQR